MMTFVTQMMVYFGHPTELMPPADDFEHLTCFVGGMLALGEAIAGVYSCSTCLLWHAG